MLPKKGGTVTPFPWTSKMELTYNFYSPPPIKHNRITKINISIFTNLSRKFQYYTLKFNETPKVLFVQKRNKTRRLGSC